MRATLVRAWPNLRPQRTCHRTGEPISPGATYVAALIEDDDGQLVRRSFCHDAWTDDDANASVAFWSATMPQSGKSAEQAEEAASAEAMLRASPSTDEGQRLRYLAMLTLLRRRRVRLLQHEGRSWRVQLDGEPHDVTEPSEAA
ncbi:MAG: hypothetical protein AAF561_07985 [Planctomycetota bacterium]